jgi:hypothetical protein
LAVTPSIALKGAKACVWPAGNSIGAPCWTAEIQKANDTLSRFSAQLNNIIDDFVLWSEV